VALAAAVVEKHVRRKSVLRDANGRLDNHLLEAVVVVVETVWPCREAWAWEMVSETAWGTGWEMAWETVWEMV